MIRIKKHPLFHAVVFQIQISSIHISCFMILYKKIYYFMRLKLKFNLYQLINFDRVFNKILMNFL